MVFDFAALERTTLHAQTAGAFEAPFYAVDLLPALQSTLASLADLDIRHEIERDYLEEWSGPVEVKQRLMATLDKGWRRDREPIVQRLTRLQEDIKAHAQHIGPRA